MLDDPTPAPADEVPLYPNDQAFVIALRRDADVAEGRLVGRVEHVTSGHVALFANLDGLVDFMRRLSGRQPTTRD
jgi:rhodanese-related sulfurtransferase